VLDGERLGVEVRGRVLLAVLLLVSETLSVMDCVSSRLSVRVTQSKSSTFFLRTYSGTAIVLSQTRKLRSVIWKSRFKHEEWGWSG
jgi:hypothetical protein